MNRTPKPSDIPAQNEQIEQLQAEIERLRAEIEQLKGELPIPAAWWADCPGLAQKTMERVIDRNDKQAEEIEQLQAENKRLKGKKHISFTQAREMILFSAERSKQRNEWENTKELNKQLQAEHKGLRTKVDLARLELAHIEGEKTPTEIRIEQALKENKNATK